MKNPRIIFMGTPLFAADILEGLLANDYNVIAVVTQSDKEVGRKKKLTFSPVKEVALKHEIPCFQPLKIRKEYAELLTLNADLILTCAYGQIIPEALLKVPKLGAINTHGSLLPQYRGGAPIQRALMNGEKETGITLMYMDAKMDEGDILYQERIAIAEDDTSTTLFAKLSALALKMLLKYLPCIINGEAVAVKQDNSLATYAYNLKKEDEFINFNRDVLTVYNHIRGLLTNPGAYGVIENKQYKFHALRYTKAVITAPGVVYGLYDNALAVGALNGTILLDVIQAEGKKALKAKVFYNGQGRELVGKSFREKL